MAETPSKRQREETTQITEEFSEAFKRQKSYNDILSLLESEEDEPNEDLSSLITTLQQELSSPEAAESQTTPSSTVVEDYASSSFSSSSLWSSSSCLSPAVLKEDDQEEDDKGRVMRHLLEASDDELGIPNRAVGFAAGDDGFNGGDGFSLPEGIWELEDEAANYYTLLQSELFM